jgi:hypothetical protein
VCQPECDAPTGRFSIFKAELLCLALFQFLLLHILPNDALIDSYRTYEIPSGPESSAPILFPNLWHLLEHPNRYSAFDCAYHFAHCILWCNGKDKMSMIIRYVPFYYFYPFPFADLPYPISCFLPYYTSQNPKSIFWAEYNMVIAKICGM